MEFKLYILIFCTFQMQLLLRRVSAYPQTTIGNNDDDTQQVSNQPEIVEFQLHQNDRNLIHDICLEKKRTGPCKAAVPKYFLNQGTGQCERFLYGGCDGTNNRFDSLSQCEQKCSKHLRQDEPITIQGRAGNETNPELVCELPHTEGPRCRQSIPRWTYNSTAGKCIQITYEGCGETKNNFRNKHSCESMCGSYKKVSLPSSDNQALKKAPNACKLPANAGPCEAAITRYYFNEENNRCEQFIYGGCGGNENNFRNAEQCIRTCGGDEPSHVASCSEVQCPWSRYTHYTAMGCKPIYDGGACCPTRFDCPDSNLTSNSNQPMCRYQGNFYSVGEEVKDASSQKDCRTSCICSGYGGKARIQCASMECPEHLGGVSPDKISCRRLYKRGSCCADSFYCPNATRTDEPPQKGPSGPSPPPVEPYECQLEGKTYYEGERMYPKKSNCLTCLCQKGFNGTLSAEFCDKIDCGFEIYYSDQLERGCAPIYFQDSDGVDRCCPIGWKCPEESNTAPTPPATPDTSGRTPPVSGPQGPITILPKPLPDSAKVVTLSDCQLPTVTGPCRAHRARFSFNGVSKKCEPFTYGGCKGNKNNFVSVQDCQRICENNQNSVEVERDNSTIPLLRSRSGPIFIQPTPAVYTLTETDPCEQPKKTGSCRAYLPRYYFSPEENTCKFFVYGGCKGNENNFYTQTSCEAKCQNRLPAQTLRSDQNAGRVTEPSTAATGFRASGGMGDSSKVTFDSGNSRGSTNFNIVDITPASICSLPAMTGRCKAHVRRFYFDGTQCKLFTYGGCGGNANNFRDLDECNTHCRIMDGDQVNSLQRSPSPKWRSAQITLPDSRTNQPSIVFEGTERCQLPVKIGSCYGRFQSYYYDVISRSCQNFTYSGCFGNTNRFGDLEECKTICERPLDLERASELPLTRSGQPHILPVPEQNEGQDRQLLPGEVVVVQPDQQTQDAVVPTTDEEVFDERVFCALPKEKGPCKGNSLRYFWDTNTQSCLPFYFGGCGGNKNNFLTESDCISICGEKPTLEHISQDGILSCSFGNKTLAFGTVLDDVTRPKGENSNEEPPCGIPVCSCQTPPVLTCIHRGCPRPVPPILPPQVITNDDNRPPPCPVPDCRPNCKRGTSQHTGCPICDCDSSKSEFEIEHVIITSSTEKGVKG